MNRGRNLSVAFVVLPICIFPRLSIIFSAGAEIFFPRLHGIFHQSTGLKFSDRVAQTGLKLSSYNRELCFSSILLEDRVEISARLGTDDMGKFVQVPPTGGVLICNFSCSLSRNFVAIQVA